jgi:diphthamide synthase subunit DPH2
MQEWGRALENDPVERKAHAASRAALSLLERRMGAMARALRAATFALEHGTPVDDNDPER